MKTVKTAAAKHPAPEKIYANGAAFNFQGAGWAIASNKKQRKRDTAYIREDLCRPTPTASPALPAWGATGPHGEFTDADILRISDADLIVMHGERNRDEHGAIRYTRFSAELARRLSHVQSQSSTMAGLWDLLDSLLRKVNRVTAPHRHGNKVSADAQKVPPA